MHKSEPKQTKLCCICCCIWWVRAHLCSPSLLLHPSLVLAVMSLVLSMQRHGPPPLCVECKYELSSVVVLFCFFSHRAKPAASSNSNSNDAGGVDEPDLEKMKQVFYFLRLRIKKNGFCNFLLVSVTSQEYCFYHFLHQWSATSFARINFITSFRYFLELFNSLFETSSCFGVNAELS